MTNSIMQPTAADWQPPIANTTAGVPRRVGVELEFSGLSFGATARAVADWAGTEPDYQSLVEAKIEHPQLGIFGIEVDWLYLQEQAREQKVAEGSDSWVKLLRQAARLTVPVEVVAPPVAVADLPQLELLIRHLRAAGATGTDSPIAAFGLQFNPEVPALTSEAITPYIRAFALMEWWLVKQHEVDITRRLSPYVDTWPEHYLDRVLNYHSPPSMEQLLQDYFDHNPTRNRALDLWPLFAEYAPERVEELMHEPHIKARPTFHYRLPNCAIDRPDWQLWHEWRVWLTVERLATEPEAVEQLASDFYRCKRPWLGVSKHQWIERIDTWFRHHYD